MNKLDKSVTSLIIRYALIILFGFNLWILYKLLTLPTLYLVKIILNSFSITTIQNNLIYFNNLSIELIPACISASAYYLLFILLLSIPNINIKKRASILLLSFFSFFIANVLRICLLSFWFNSTYFDLLHKSFWFILSTMFVVLIWFSLVKIFEIKQIPFYTDFIFLYNKTH